MAIARKRGTAPTGKGTEVGAESTLPILGHGGRVPEQAGRKAQHARQLQRCLGRRRPRLDDAPVGQYEEQEAHDRDHYVPDQGGGIPEGIDQHQSEVGDQNAPTMSVTGSRPLSIHIIAPIFPEEPLPGSIRLPAVLRIAGRTRPGPSRIRPSRSF